MAGVKKYTRVFIYVILLLIILAVVGGLVYLTRGGKTDIKTFAMVIGKTPVVRDENHITISSGEEISVKSSSDYTVSVYAYTEYNDFALVVDGEEKLWSDFSEVDFLTKEDSGLTIDKQADMFTLSYDDFKSIVSATGEVEVLGKLIGDIFRMEVTSNGCTITISFTLDFDFTLTVSPDELKH